MAQDPKNDKRPVVEVQPDDIPEELRNIAQWVVWKYEIVDGKPTKVLYNPRTGRKADVTRPATWTTFSAALKVYQNQTEIYAGIGIVVTKALGITGVDLDHVVTGNGFWIEPGAIKIIRELYSYTERTPSGEGLRVLVKARKPGVLCKNAELHTEIYDDKRFFTVTGENIKAMPATIEKRQPQLEALYKATFAEKLRAAKNQTTPASRPVEPLDLADEEIIRLACSAKNGSSFNRLWSGAWEGRHKSQSEADLALCNLLAFWTRGNPTHIDRLFRRSGLMREKKWDRKLHQSTYGKETIARACRETTEHYQPPKPKKGGSNMHQNPNPQTKTETSAPPPVLDPPNVEQPETETPQVEEEPEAELKESAAESPPTQAEVKPYAFITPCGENHYITKWVEYASQRTDAAHEYHEAAALIQLAAGTPNMRAQLAQTPYGLGGNLYFLIIGNSTTSRKSTAARLACHIVEDAIPGGLCADQMSPEGLVETLAARPADSTLWYVDEFADLVNKLHSRGYMAGIEGLILNIYEGANYTHTRHSKRSKSGVKIPDVDEIRNPHLSILGATTPTIFETATHRDIISGLLPRFAIVLPRNKPLRRSLSMLPPTAISDRDVFVKWLRSLHEWNMEKKRSVDFAPDVLARLDEFAAEIEQNSPDSDIKCTMLERLNVMTHKLAILIAAGRPGVAKRESLTVTIEDAEAAIVIGSRFKDDALVFAERIGENNFERTLQQCLRIIEQRGMVPRWVIAKNAHMKAKALDEVRDALVDRGMVTINPSPSEGRPGELWIKRG
jgi:putative DNA primase/helicase